MARSLVDTNILVYAQDLREAVKRPRAIELLDRLSTGGEFVLSVQCLNEFSSVVLRRGMPIANVRAAVSAWSGLAEVLPMTQAVTSAGLAAVERHGLRKCGQAILKHLQTGKPTAALRGLLRD